MTIFEYNTLRKDQDKLLEQCHNEGYISIRGVPGFADVYQNFLVEAQKFIALPSAAKEDCSP